MKDLEIRGAGNMLGAEQSGHIAAVGFDAYARILQESMAEMKGEEIPEEQELRIDLPVKAFVPPGWVAQEALRLELYRRISLAPDHETLEQIRTETVDRYGALPDEVETLFAIASLRVTARSARRRGDLDVPRSGAAQARRDPRRAAARSRGARVRGDATPRSRTR